MPHLVRTTFDSCRADRIGWSRRLWTISGLMRCSKNSSFHAPRSARLRAVARPRPSTKRSSKSLTKTHGNPTSQINRTQGFHTAKVKIGENEASIAIPNLGCAPAGSPRGGSCLLVGGRNHFLTLKCRKSGGGWFFLIGIKLPSAPSIYCSLPMNTSVRSSVQLFSVHITVGKRV
jgi:hypothetical protein